MSFDLVKEIYYFLLNNTFSTCFIFDITLHHDTTYTYDITLHIDYMRKHIFNKLTL